MSTKPKSNALLKNLPRERQDQIAEWCEKANEVDPETGKSIPKTGGLAYAQEQLLADGLKVSLPTLGEFHSWYCLQRTFTRAEQQAKDVEEMLKRDFPGATPEKIAAAGQLVFTMQAANAGDADTFKELEYLRVRKEEAAAKAKIDLAKLKQKDAQILQKDRDLELATRRVELLEAREKSAKETLGDGTLTPEQRQAKMKQIFGVQ